MAPRSLLAAAPAGGRNPALAGAGQRSAWRLPASSQLRADRHELPVQPISRAQYGADRHDPHRAVRSAARAHGTWHLADPGPRQRHCDRECLCQRARRALRHTRKRDTLSAASRASAVARRLRLVSSNQASTSITRSTAASSHRPSAAHCHHRRHRSVSSPIATSLLHWVGFTRSCPVCRGHRRRCHALWSSPCQCCPPPHHN